MSFFIEVEKPCDALQDLLQECIDTIFDKKNFPEQDSADKFIALLQSHNKYLQERERLERIKAQKLSNAMSASHESKGKGKKGKGKASFAKAQNSYTALDKETATSAQNDADKASAPSKVYVSAGADNNCAGALSVRLATAEEKNRGYIPVDELSSDNSIFADYMSVFQLLFAVKKKVNPDVLYAELLRDDIFFELSSNLAIYNCITTLALNRTIIECSDKQIDDDVLTNSCDLLTKLPQWSICLDFSKHPIAVENSTDSITSLVISRQPFMKKSGLTIEAPSVVNSEKDIFYNNLCLMLSLNNKQIFTCDVELLLDSEKSIAQLTEEIQTGAKEYIQLARKRLEHEKKEAKLKKIANSEEAQAMADELTDDFYMVKLSRDNYNAAIKKAMKQAVYFLAHQSELKDAKGENVVLENTPYSHLKTADLYDLTKEAPYNKCFI